MRTKQEALVLLVRNLCAVQAGVPEGFGQRLSHGALTELGFSEQGADDAWDALMDEMSKPVTILVRHACGNRIVPEEL